MLSFDIFREESLVILSSSRSGKSVLTKTIIGLLISDSGFIKVDSKNKFRSFISKFRLV
ncbi:MAG: ATP-binding cassette domain-containing protein [Wolbachia endosymbiont of Meromenopon meropis]|nr:ATP-binding cassette domain-containing protein [Wolbachia endosymbiont of Meromenopon meropis]